VKSLSKACDVQTNLQQQWDRHRCAPCRLAEESAILGSSNMVRASRFANSFSIQVRTIRTGYGSETTIS